MTGWSGLHDWPPPPGFIPAGNPKDSMCRVNLYVRDECGARTLERWRWRRFKHEAELLALLTEPQPGRIIHREPPKEEA